MDYLAEYAKFHVTYYGYYVILYYALKVKYISTIFGFNFKKRINLLYILKIDIRYFKQKFAIRLQLLEYYSY